MILLDTNIFIYFAKGVLAPTLLDGHEIAYASITRIEALGYGKITGTEYRYLENWLDLSESIDLTEKVIQKAIHLRQQASMTLGDAIIAASALVYNLPLWTNNEKDFAHIADLKLYNPLKQ